jgi:hypothetical protein
VTILAVDLAAKYSAACLMNDDYKVISQFDSWVNDEDVFVHKLAVHRYNDGPSTPDVMIVEDLPHGLNYTKLVKKVLRLQGRIVHAMNMYHPGGAKLIVFAAPNAWRAHFQGMERGTGSAAVFPVSAGFGYVPPDFTERTKGKGGNGLATKIASDYCSAYLIARWAIDMNTRYGTYDVPGTSRYDTDPILKKDFDANKAEHSQER